MMALRSPSKMARPHNFCIRASEHQTVARVHPDAMSGHDHIHDAIDLVRARLSRRIDAEDALLNARGVDNEVCQRQILFGQTRVAAMLARALGVHEGRTPEQVLDSLSVAVMEVEAIGPDEDSRCL